MGLHRFSLRNALFAALFVCAAIPARASILLEPYVGYEMTSFSYTQSGNDYKLAVNNPNFGLRLGYSALIFWTALDYSTMSGSSSVSSQPSGSNITAPNYSRSTLSLDVGVHVPMLRAYAGYAFLNTLTDKTSSPNNTFGGYGLRFGASYTGLPLLAVNLEYWMSTYTTINSGGGDQSIGGSGTSVSKASAGTLLLSVSAPFEF
jgi:Outer membrane protein beta-barrel domain